MPELGAIEREYKAKIPVRRELRWIWIVIVVIQSFNFAADFSEGRSLRWSGIAAGGAWGGLVALFLARGEQKVRFHAKGIAFRDFDTHRERAMLWEQVRQYQWEGPELRLSGADQPAKLLWPPDKVAEVQELLRAYAPLAIRG
ncbi:MAG: hypothetical protein K2X35_24015 [Bryobacteraceae bacterium]|nr:hypothetical protein [Bryobacteraceae bacterium]